MELSRPDYWSRLPLPSPGDPPNPGIEPRSPTLQVDSLSDEPQGKPKNTGMGSLSFLRGSSWSRNLGQRISYKEGRFFTNWAIREAQRVRNSCQNLGLNQGPLDLQSNTLPTELFQPPITYPLHARWFIFTSVLKSNHFWQKMWITSLLMEYQ